MSDTVGYAIEMLNNTLHNHGAHVEFNDSSTDEEMTLDKAWRQLWQILIVSSKNERNEKEIDALDEQAIKTAILTIERMERLMGYINNPKSGMDGLVHKDDVLAVMAGYEA